jgi:hypothetical protein
LLGLKNRVGKTKLDLPIATFAGTYVNELDGPITIKAINANTLKVYFDNHVNLSATMQYMDNGEWLIIYDNIDYGFFKTAFVLKDKKVVSLPLRVSDFVDYDTYIYTKKN